MRIVFICLTVLMTFVGLFCLIAINVIYRVTVINPYFMWGAVLVIGIVYAFLWHVFFQRGSRTDWSGFGTRTVLGALCLGLPAVTLFLYINLHGAAPIGETLQLGVSETYPAMRRSPTLVEVSIRGDEKELIVPDAEKYHYIQMISLRLRKGYWGVPVVDEVTRIK